MSVIRIFSYGSNMLAARIKNRIKSYSVLGVGYIREHTLKFHKKSIDLSGKADAYYSGEKDDLVWGVVGIIDEKDKFTLDNIEGLGRGYNQKTIEVYLKDDSVISATIYYADKKYINGDLKPYNWYKRFVIEGAKENKLPNKYIIEIEKIESIIDANTERREKNLELIRKAST